MKETYITISFPLEVARMREHIIDREDGTESYASGADALAQLRDMLDGCYVNAYVDEDGTVRLGIAKKSETIDKPKSGRPKKEGWPEGLDTDAERLAWLESVSVKEAMETLEVSRRTYYRRLDELKGRVHAVDECRGGAQHCAGVSCGLYPDCPDIQRFSNVENNAYNDFQTLYFSKH